LTDQQELFCMLYVQYFNATKAYQEVYGCSYNAAKCNGYQLLTKPEIIKAIDKLKKAQTDAIKITQDDVFARIVEIAFSDSSDRLKALLILLDRYFAIEHIESTPAVTGKSFKSTVEALIKRKKEIP
jgi:hypothetical protein